jgi:hypothetical protein
MNVAVTGTCSRSDFFHFIKRSSISGDDGNCVSFMQCSHQPLLTELGLNLTTAAHVSVKARDVECNRQKGQSVFGNRNLYRDRPWWPLR